MEVHSISEQLLLFVQFSVFVGFIIFLCRKARGGQPEGVVLAARKKICDDPRCIRCAVSADGANSSSTSEQFLHRARERYKEMVMIEEEERHCTDSVSSSRLDLAFRCSMAVATHMRTTKAMLSEDEQRQVAAIKSSPTLFLYPGLASHPLYHSPSIFYPWVSDLESFWPHIRTELLTLLQDTSVGVWTESVAGWQRFDLWNQGTEQRANCELVPCTMRALRHLGDDLMRGCIFGFVYFSVLRGDDGRSNEEEEEDDDDDGGKTAPVEEAIPPHSGPTNVRLRCHMAIAVSQALSCELIVNGGTTATAATTTATSTTATTTTTTSWQEGKCFLLDDSFVHSVKITQCKSRVHRDDGNDGDDGGDGSSPGAAHERIFRQSLLRAVLIVDVWHYQLSPLERETLRQVFA